jgi:hypothetical protein
LPAPHSSSDILFSKKLKKRKRKNTSTPIPGADLPLWYVHEEESDR